MADIQITRQHTLGPDAARQLAEAAAQELAQRYDMRWHWAGNQICFQRPGAQGTIGVSDTQIVISVELGFLLKAFKRDIEDKIKVKLAQLFEPPPGVT